MGHFEPTNAVSGLPRAQDGPGAAPIQPSWRVVLPWPDLRELGGNSDANRYDRARARRVARTDACYTAWDCRPPAPYRHVELRLDFSPPDHRQRDIDNLVHAAKSYIDGLVDAGVLAGDSTRDVSALHVHCGEPMLPYGAVTITVIPLEEHPLLAGIERRAP